MCFHLGTIESVDIWCPSSIYRQNPKLYTSRHTTVMSFPARSLQPHIRQASMAGSASSAGQSPALVARVNEKKAELENLRELRDLSAAVASQMEALEQKLGTLSDGTEGMVCSRRSACDVSPGELNGRGLTEINSDRSCHEQLAQRPPCDQHGLLLVFLPNLQ